MDTTRPHFQTHQNQQNTHSKSKLLAVLTLFPLGGLCLILSALILTGTLIGLTVATPVFVLFSPILVPALITIGLAVTGFLTSGAFGITALSALTYIVNYFRKMGGGASAGVGGSVHDQLDYAKRRATDTAGYLGQKVKDVGQKTQDYSGRT
ncbi:oleosin 18.2 kDa-like protein [Tanacetum coccineum]